MSVNDQADVQRMEMAERLREAREYIGLSQDDVAKTLGLSRPAITNIEAGSRKVEAVELDRLSRLYRRSVTYLLTGEDGASNAPEQVAFLARSLNGLSKKDLTEVARFADFLRQSASASTKPAGKRGGG